MRNKMYRPLAETCYVMTHAFTLVIIYIFFTLFTLNF